MKTKAQLISERIEFLKQWKLELKEHPDRKWAFKAFKQNCRDRHHDAIAGMVESPKGSNLFKEYVK